jgi:hypothetical protein
MKKPIRFIMFIIFALLVGSAVNMGLIMISSSIIPLPEGIDPANMDSLIENMHLLEAKHFIMPFLAHALGTFVAALVASRLLKKSAQKAAYTCGVFFLLGGIANAFMIPAPLWFILVDLAGAYLPMSYLALKVHKA